MSDEHVDPRSEQPTGDEGMPGELLDRPENLPGDQPDDTDPPADVDTIVDD